ncbi:MAG: TIGR00341 family protein [Planctomycetota bacterium]
MPERICDIIIPSARRGELIHILDEATLQRYWYLHVEDRSFYRVLVRPDQVEDLIDETERVFLGADPFQIVVSSVEAVVPVPEDDPDELNLGGRLSRHELLDDLAGAVRVDRIFCVTVVLSTIVAAIGLLKGSGAILVGAMVIAPLLGPNMLLAFGTTLGDSKLVLKALRANGVGFLITFLTALPIGLAAELDVEAPEVIARTHVELLDVVLALASGVAGALAYTTGISGALVGVMVAVAILPPAVCSSMLLARGNFHDGLYAVLLVAINVVCVNLAAVGTFLFQGVRPRTWWAANRSKKATRLAITFWVLALSILIVLVILSFDR